MAGPNRPARFDPRKQPDSERDYDITIPPSMHTGTGAAGQFAPSDADLEPTFEGRRDSAGFYTTVTIGTLAALIAWSFAVGTGPGVDDQLGLLTLIGHFTVWLVGWLALDAALDAWRLHREELERFGATTDGGLDSQSRAALVLALGAGAAVFVNTVLVIAAVVS